MNASSMRTFANVHSTLFGGLRRKLLSFPRENPFRYLPIIPITQDTPLTHSYITELFFSVNSKNVFVSKYIADFQVKMDNFPELMAFYNILQAIHFLKISSMKNVNFRYKAASMYTIRQESTEKRKNSTICSLGPSGLGRIASEDRSKICQIFRKIFEKRLLSKRKDELIIAQPFMLCENRKG